MITLLMLSLLWAVLFIPVVSLRLRDVAVLILMVITLLPLVFLTPVVVVSAVLLMLAIIAVAHLALDDEHQSNDRQTTIYDRLFVYFCDSCV